MLLCLYPLSYLQHWLRITILMWKLHLTILKRLIMQTIVLRLVIAETRFKWTLELILFGLTILDHSTSYKLYVCLWKPAVGKISSFYFYIYLKNCYVLLFFNPAMLLLWQPVLESKWAKHVCQTSWNFSLQIFTIKITKKKKNKQKT